MLQEPSSETTNSPDEVTENEPRDTLLMRWIKFASITVLLAGLVGCLFGFYIHVVALYSAAKWTVNDPYSHTVRGTTKADVDRSNRDTMQAFKTRFLIGSVVGGCFGLVFVVRCLVKDEDP